jgi:Tol biopolymer transport system component
VRRVVAGIVGVIVFLLVAMPASGTLPGANGKIAFVRLSQLWLMDGDGSGQTLLADLESPSPDNFVNLYSLSWSPDGAKLAFEYRQIGSGMLCGAEDFLCSSIAILDVATAELELVRIGVATPPTPTWSPDGTQLAFRDNDPNGGGGTSIHVMDVDGSHARRLAHSARIEFGRSTDYDPSWSPDGARIAFVSSRIEGEPKSWTLFTVNTNGRRNVQRLMAVDGNDIEPDWSPDGSKIVFVRTFGYPDYRIYTVTADGLVQTELLRDNTPVEGPKWSPDATKIVYQSPTGIYVMSANGTGSTLLASGRSPAWQPLP